MTYTILVEIIMQISTIHANFNNIVDFNIINIKIYHNIYLSIPQIEILTVEQQILFNSKK